MRQMFTGRDDMSSNYCQIIVDNTTILCQCNCQKKMIKDFSSLLHQDGNPPSVKFASVLAYWIN